MFNVGDKAVYPIHGAGIIEAIEEKTVLGQKKKYYVMSVQYGKMTVLIPMDNSEEVGLREVITKEEAAKVIDYFKNEPLHDDVNWNRRQRENMSKMKTGNIYRVLDVLKDLMYREKCKGLSTSERKVLSNAKQIVVSELVMSEFAGREDVEMIMDGIIEKLIADMRG